MNNAPKGYLTISEAADQLGVTPWDILRLVDRDQLRGVMFIDAGSLLSHQQETA